jgi:hypothetical protein
LTGSYLLHATSDSLTSYPVTFRATDNIAFAPPSRAITPVPRSVSSTTASSPNPEHTLRRNASLASLRDVEPKDKDRGFAKFLAVRRNKGPEEKEKEDKVGIGEGKEVERDGGGSWRMIKVGEGGEGVGIALSTVDVRLFSWCLTSIADSHSVLCL